MHALVNDVFITRSNLHIIAIQGKGTEHKILWLIARETIISKGAGPQFTTTLFRIFLTLKVLNF